MNRWLRIFEFGLVLVLALAIHLALFLRFDSIGGSVAAGDGGDALVSLEASDAQIAALVAEWERPPEPVTEVPEPTPLPVPLTPPAAPLPATVVQVPLPDLPSRLDLVELAPPPPPEPLPEPVAEPEPVPEPQVEPEPAVAEVPPATRPQPRPERRRRQPEPASQPQRQGPSSTAVAEQRAAGSGGGAHAGDAGQAAAATWGANVQDALAGWGAAVRARVERRASVPPSARGARGTVWIQIRVGRNGGLLAATITRSSGNPVLDAAALQAVHAVRGLPAAPVELTEPSYAMAFPIELR